MKISSLNSILSSINSFEEYELLKNKTEILENIAKEIIHRHQLSVLPLTLFSEGTNIVFSYGDCKVIKIFPSCHLEQFKCELLVLQHLEGNLSIKTPNVEFNGEVFGWPYIVMTKLEGTLLEGLWEKITQSNKILIIRELGSLIREVHSLPTNGLEAIDCHWQKFISKQINECVAQHQATKLADALLQQIPKYLESAENILPKIKKPVILTGEYTPMNILVKQKSGMWHINGLIDFGDSMLGLPEYDLLGPGAFLIQGDKTLLREFLNSYGYLSEDMTTELSRQFTALMLLHRYSNLNAQIRIENWKSKVTDLNDLEKLVWGF